MQSDDLGLRLERIRMWLLNSRMPGHEMAAVNAASEIAQAIAERERLVADARQAALGEDVANALLQRSRDHVDRLKEALEPLADFVPDFFDDGCDDADVVSLTSRHGNLDLTLTVGDFRRARQALSPQSPDDTGGQRK